MFLVRNSMDGRDTAMLLSQICLGRDVARVDIIHRERDEEKGNVSVTRGAAMRWRHKFLPRREPLAVRRLLDPYARSAGHRDRT